MFLFGFVWLWFDLGLILLGEEYLFGLLFSAFEVVLLFEVDWSAHGEVGAVELGGLDGDRWLDNF